MFILKKLIAHLLLPVPVCLALLIAGLLLLLFTQRQRAGKLIISIGVILLTLLSYPAVSHVLLRPLEYHYPPLMLTTTSDTARGEATPSVKWIVVLGGGHTSDPKIPITSQISEASLVRLIEAIRLHNKIPGSKLILSGGKVFEVVSEAETMSEVAKAIGVNQENIVLESDSKDTVDEAHLIKPIVENDRFILVTSAAHMPRSIALFKKLGMHPIPAPTGHSVKESRGITPGIFFPTAEGLCEIECALHEYLGMVWAKLRGQI